MSGQKFISEAPGSGGERAILQEAAGTVGAGQGQGNGGRGAVWFGDGARKTCLGGHCDAMAFGTGWSLLSLVARWGCNAAGKMWLLRSDLRCPARVV